MNRATFLVFALLVGATSAVAGTPTPHQVDHSTRTHGARQTVRSLEARKQFDAVLDRISTGNVAWVGLAPALAKGTDAGDSEGLTVALATALPKNPGAVMAILDDGSIIGVNAVCGLPFIEPTHQEANDYLARAIPAVTAVAPSSRVPRRTACLDALHRAQESVRTQR